MRRRLRVDGIRQRANSIKGQLNPIRCTSLHSVVERKTFFLESQAMVVLSLRPILETLNSIRFKISKMMVIKVAYLPYNGMQREYNHQLQALEEPLELVDTYAIAGT
ncbi:hypothetical protein PABG_01621 [Paracoccidioides brasiliensis Pb03]|nr:hypothetical protein PABG_01621 [Paracoccidioides brasiliensis Pb03]